MEGSSLNADEPDVVPNALRLRSSLLVGDFAYLDGFGSNFALQPAEQKYKSLYSVVAAALERYAGANVILYSLFVRITVLARGARQE